MRENDFASKGNVPIMSFYFGPVNVGWLYIEPPHFEIRTFRRSDIDFDSLTDYYPDLVLINLHIKEMRHYFADAYILKIRSKDVKDAFKEVTSEFEPYKEYFDKILHAIYVTNFDATSATPWVLAGRRASLVEIKTMKQLVWGLHLLEMNQYITLPLFTGEDS